MFSLEDLKDVNKINHIIDSKSEALFLNDIEKEILLPIPSKEKASIFFSFLFSTPLVNIKDSKFLINHIQTLNTINNIIEKVDFNIPDFLQLKVNIKNYEVLPIESITWIRNIENYKPFFSIEKLKKELDNPNFSQYVNIAMSHHILSSNEISYVINNYQFKDEEYRKMLLSIQSFYTLTEAEKAGVNVWQVINKHETQVIETLVPFYATQCESTYFKYMPLECRTSLSNRIEYLTQNIKKWENCKTNYTTNKDFKTRAALSVVNISKESQYKKILKSWSIKQLDLNVLDCIGANQKLYQTSDFLLRAKKMSLVTSLAKNSEAVLPTEKNGLSPIVQLLKAIPENANKNKITTQKRFAKMWYKALKETDFNYETNRGNIAHQLLCIPKLAIYLPLRTENLLNEPEKINSNHFNFMSDTMSENWEKVFKLLEIKNVDFNLLDKNGLNVSNSLIVKILENSTNGYGEWHNAFEENSFINKILLKNDNQNHLKLIHYISSHWDELITTKTLETFDYLLSQKYESSHPIWQLLNILEPIVRNLGLSYEDSQNFNQKINNLKAYENFKEFPHHFYELIEKKTLNTKLSETLSIQDTPKTKKNKI